MAIFNSKLWTRLCTLTLAALKPPVLVNLRHRPPINDTRTETPGTNGGSPWMDQNGQFLKILYIYIFQSNTFKESTCIKIDLMDWHMDWIWLMFKMAFDAERRLDQSRKPHHRTSLSAPWGHINFHQGASSEKKTRSMLYELVSCGWRTEDGEYL